MDDVLLKTIGGPSREALERLIYVVGSARGGTTITSRIIALHDSVVAFGSESQFLNHAWRYRKHVHDNLWQQLLWSPKSLRPRKVRNSLPEMQRRAFVKLLNRTMAQKDLHDLYCLYPLVRALDPQEKQDPACFLAWLDKGTDFWGVDRLPRAFPHARFVFVVRDPRGAIASQAKIMADRRADTEFAVEPRDVINSALYWRHMVYRQARLARRHPGRTVFLRFEDLTARPAETASKLFDALELPPLPQAELRRRLDDLGYKASIDRTERGKGVSTAPNARWKSKLGRESLDLISEICGTSARAFGYNLPPPAQRRGWVGLARRVPGLKGKPVTLAKLVYLSLVDWSHWYNS